MRALKWVLVSAGALIVLVAAGVAILVATFDPNEYKPRLVELVKARTGRTLTVDGRIELTLFPKIGASIGKASLSERNGPVTFARMDEVRVGVALLPLLSRQVVVDGVTLKGLSLDLVRYKDGRSNFDDLAGASAAPPKQTQVPGPRPTSPPLAIDIGRITMDNANIRWRDERDGTDVRLSGLTLKTGRLASGVPGKLALSARVDGAQPKAHLQVSLETAYRLDFGGSAVALSSLDAKVSGDTAAFTGLEARVKGETVDLEPRTPRVTLSRVELQVTSKDGLDAKVMVPRLELAPDHALSQAITGQIALSTPARSLSAKLSMSPISARGTQVALSQVAADLTMTQADLSVAGRLGTAIALDLERQRAELRAITGDLTITSKSLPKPSKAAVTGAAQADWGAQNARGQLGIKLDDSTIDATASVTRWNDPILAFALVADRLDVDRYLPPSKPSPSPRAAGGSGSSGGGSPAAGRAAAETPIDLSPLRTLNATGTVKVGMLHVSNIKAEQVAITIKAAGGRVDVSPIAAALYQGTLAGSAIVNARDMSFATRQKLTGVSVGPLLRDVADKDLLEGRGTVTLDVTTTGNTATALKKALAGTADFALRDGAIKGIDIPGIIRLASTVLGSKSAVEQPAQGGARTEFTDLTGTFVIARGVAHNEDLVLRSPVLHLTGRGDIDVGESRMDYTAKASLVAPPKGQGPKELAQLAGVSVPVRVTGPLAEPKYTVDVQELAGELAKSTLRQELERRLGGKSGGQGGSASDALGEALRGLFGKPK